MLLRIWTAEVDPRLEAEYLAHAQTHSRPMFLAQDGCLGVLFVRRADGRHAACSFWRDAAAIEALARSAGYQRTAAGLAATGALVGEAHVEILTVTGGGLTAPMLVAPEGVHGG